MTSVNDLVSGTINRIDSIPANITGSPIMYEYLNDARIDVQNITGAGISESDVVEAYQSIIKNLGAAYTLSRMTGQGIDFNYKLGNFSVKKGKNTASDGQIEFLISQVNRSLLFLGTKIPFKFTFQ